MITKKCIVCGKEFTMYNYRKNTAKYCSIECQHKGITGDGNARHWLGRKDKEGNKSSFKKENIPWNKGKKLHYEVWNKGKKMKNIPWNKGKRMSEEIRKKMSESKKGTVNLKMRGENHPNWKGGTSELRKLIQALNLYREWRSSVFKRDDYTCQKCNKRGGRLHMHHIKPFYKIIKDNNIKTVDDAKQCKELWDVNNGQTLCIACHIQTDSYLVNQHKKS